MYAGKKILAVIPARGGSKGLPDKNILPLCGIPLVAHSILAAGNCAYIDEIVVSTDSPRIAEIAEAYGAWIPFLRPDDLAQDTSRTIDSLVYTVERLREMGYTYDYLMLLQPTQPYREAFHLTESIEAIADNQWASLASVSESPVHPILMRRISDDGLLQNFLTGSSTVRRQDFPSVYHINGSIYINRLEDGFDGSVSLNDNRHPYVMDAKYAIDIDTWEDFQFAEWVMGTAGREQEGKNGWG
ncbi:acylneuraminate cytidylyltransferase family protein [Clostridiaceae bacterium]|nr:acylneuraminate cytidylyltransferase family protein [Clostridiaceae bacterium]